MAMSFDKYYHKSSLQRFFTIPSHFNVYLLYTDQNTDRMLAERPAYGLAYAPAELQSITTK